MSKQGYIQINNLNDLLNDNSLSLSSKCDHLLLYINQTFGQEINIITARAFFNELPSIFSYLYQSKIENEKDYYALFNLFNPIYPMLNLFSIIIYPFIPEMHHYMLDLQIISPIFSTENNNCLLSHSHKILKEFIGNSFIQNESTNHIYQSNKCVLPLYEYFIVIFLISAKKIEYTNRKFLNVKQENKETFSSLFTIKRAITPDENEELNQQLDITRSLQYNFFKNILMKYINFFYDNGMKTKLDFIYKAMNIVWLYDYSTYDNERIVKIIDKGKKTAFSKIFNLISSSCSTAISLKNNINKGMTCAQYPNLLIIDCLIEVILFTYEKLHIENLLPFRTHLFFFIRFCFENISTFYLTDVNINDIIKLWYSYITPWKVINKNGSYNQSDNIITSFIYANIPFYTELLNKCLIAFTSLRNNETNLLQLTKALEMFSIKPEAQVVFKHLPIDQLYNFSLGNYKSFNSHDNIEKELSCYGRNEANAKQTIFPFISHIQGRQAAIKLIVNNNIIIQSLLSNNNQEKNKNEDESSSNNNGGDGDGDGDTKEKILFKSLNITNEIIGDLYQINSEEKAEFPKDNQIKYNDISKQIYLNRIIDNTKDPWKLNPNENDEISILFTVLKYCSYAIDKMKKFKGIPIDNKQTNLRPLCNKFYLVNLLTIIVIVSLLSYIIYLTTNVIKLNKN